MADQLFHLIVVFSGVKATPFDYHHCLGHPSKPILRHLVSNYKLHHTSALSSSFYCKDCYCNKSHKLPFTQSTFVSSSPLKIIFYDVLTSPIPLTDNFKYYVIFVDHFTHCIWLNPLKCKSDVSLVFPRFKTLVENIFKRKIITLYSDNGGEYTGLSTFLATHGIFPHTSPLHTPKHNGFSERRHCHIVETSLALLSRAFLPLSFWSYAFLIATYVINCLPTPTLQMSSPYHKLFGTPPNYSKRRVFGCLCSQWFRSYSLHKLASQSTPYVFLGYSLTQSSYGCFDPSTTKTYHSRHVRFIELIFPLSGVNPFLPWSNESIVSTWFSITLVDSAPPLAPLVSDPAFNLEHPVLSSPPAVVDLPHARAPEPSLPHSVARISPLPTTLSSLLITTDLPFPRAHEPPIDLPLPELPVLLLIPPR